MAARVTIIGVAIVESSPSMLAGLTAIVNDQPDLHVVATALSLAPLVDAGVHTDVLLLGGGRPPQAGPLQPPSCLAKVTVRFAAPGASAMGAYTVATDADAREITRTIRLAAVGERIPGAAPAALPSLPGPLTASSGPSVRLTERERQVLALYARGATAAEVARALFLARVTVQDHVKRIRAKYESVGRPARTKLDLYIRAAEDGVLGQLDGVP